MCKTIGCAKNNRMCKKQIDFVPTHCSLLPTLLPEQGNTLKFTPLRIIRGFALCNVFTHGLV